MTQLVSAVTLMLTHMSTRHCGCRGFSSIQKPQHSLGDKDEGCWGQAATTPGCMPKQHPKPLLKQQASEPSKPCLWCPGCWPGAERQAQGIPSFPLPGPWTCSATADQLAGKKPFSMHSMTHDLWKKAARVFCPKVILYMALASHWDPLGLDKQDYNR